MDELRITDVTDDTELVLSDTEPEDRCIVISLGKDDDFLMVGLSSEEARELGTRLIEQAVILRGKA